jgi:NAD dependent epimerase/dehydratase family enzyme
VILRIGVVLHPDGGMLKELLKPLRFGIAPVLGKPDRIISWIDMEDLCRMIIFAANNNISGIYNAVAPQPATNRQLVIQLAKAKRKWFIPVRVPAFIIRMIAGEFSKELLGSVRVNGQKIVNAGFTFNFPDITRAVAAR